VARQAGALSTERRAVEIVRSEEEARGRKVTGLSKIQEREYGCDLLSDGPNGREYVEVKGWGEPLLGANGTFTFPADLNAEQYETACREGARFRLEIVADLSAERKAPGHYQRLSLTGDDIRQLATPWRYRLPLDDLADRVASRP
jgi:hypothetical protein